MSAAIDAARAEWRKLSLAFTAINDDPASSQCDKDKAWHRADGAYVVYSTARDAELDERIAAILAQFQEAQ